MDYLQSQLADTEVPHTSCASVALDLPSACEGGTHGDWLSLSDVALLSSVAYHDKSLMLPASRGLCHQPVMRMHLLVVFDYCRLITHFQSKSSQIYKT